MQRSRRCLPAGPGIFPLLQCRQHMADWKQITARIRRARSGKDPAGQLSTLFEKTRDAMVAFELARFFETSGQNTDAAKWYVTAAERFRRADWKAKAQEAAVRLGAEIAAATASQSPASSEVAALAADSELPAPTSLETTPPEETEADASLAFASERTSAAPSVESSEPDDKKRRRRGRRGGRNRRRGDARSAGAAPAAGSSVSSLVSTERTASPANEAPAEPEFRRLAHPRAIPALPIESTPEAGVASVRGRSGDPGLSSRLSALEMQLRRLLTCPPVKLNEADHAPAGPGVLVLTDSDLTSYYYVEACQTLRIAVANFLRGGSSRRGGESIKPRLAEHLGIPESRVGKYLADHCVVRWLQLDEGASHFAHFVIAVLRPTLNE